MKEDNQIVIPGSPARCSQEAYPLRGQGNGRLRSEEDRREGFVFHGIAKLTSFSVGIDSSCLMGKNSEK